MNDRLAVIGTIEETNDKQTKLLYEATSGRRSVWIPNIAIMERVKMSEGQTAILIGDVNLSHGPYNPSKNFAGGKAPLVNDPEHIEVIDALESGVAAQNVRFMMNEVNNASTSLLDDFMMGEPTVVSEDDFDDSVPVVVIETDTDVGETWDGAITFGGRESVIAHDWRFNPVMKPLFTAYQVDEGSTPTFAPLSDAKGRPISFGVFNPTYADDHRPEGALLGTVGKDYYPLAYHTVCDPILEMASQNDWKAKVYAYNEGGKMRLDCDVSQAAGTKQLTKQRLIEGGHRWIDTDVLGESARSLDGLYRYGFSINNSLDGTRALSVRAVAMRMYCTNMAVMGGSQTLAALKHTQGAMKDRDWDKFATNINDVIVAAQRQLVEMEFMQHIPVDVQLFERLITLCETKGLVSWPSVKDVEKNGQVVGHKVTGGHMWRLALDGWTNPQNDWVNVDSSQQNTLYHAYNVLNGAITHKPEWTDGTQRLKGRVIGLDTLDRRLSTVHDVMTGVMTQTIEEYRKDADVKKIGLDDINDMKSYIDENGLIRLNEVPLASEVIGL
jgi:hypothetical protein|tara:strand:- start:72 stop:1733 length:1662 start_codon:yes stop_codon:yes gene_type:complete